MRYGYRSSLFNLGRKPGNDRSVRGQYVPKAGGHKTGQTFYFSALNGQSHALDVHLGHPLGGSHDVGGVHGLVCGKEDEPVHVVGHGQVGHYLSPHNVHADSLAGVFFHEGYVLVGGRMKDHLGAVRVKNAFHALAVADIANKGHKIERRKLFGQLQAEIVHGRFGRIYQYQLANHAQLCCLPAELAAYGTGGPGDQEGFASELFLHGLHVYLNFLAAQQVHNVKRAELQAHRVLV